MEIYSYNDLLKLKRDRKKAEIKRRIFVFSIVCLIVVFGVFTHLPKKAKNRPKLVKNMAFKTYQIKKPTLTPSPTLTPKQKEYLTVENEIKLVFGKYADKAFILLQGKGCSENKQLDPFITHTNDDEFKSTDWGVFQINDHWQGITNPAFLTDYRINIRVAFNIFERDHYSFKLWTCGRYHKI